MKFKRIVSLLLVLAMGIGFLPAPAAAAGTPESATISLSNILSSGCIRLTWDAVENVKYYRIYRSETETGGYTKIKTTSSLSYTDKDAQPGETFYYLIKTVSPEGAVSASSEKVIGTAKLPRPTVTLSGVSETGKIKVSWDKIDGASSYRVYRSPDKESWELLKKTTSGSYTDASAEAGQKYYYRVMAVFGSNTDANSAYSSPKSRTCDLPSPVAAVTNDPSTGKIKVSWNKIDGASSYRLYRSVDQETWELLNKTTSGSYTDSSAQEDQTYYYKVLAVCGSNTAANSDYSAVVSGTYTLPDGLTMKLTTNEEGQPYLTWNAVKGASSYRVYRSYRETAGFKLLSTRTPLYYTNASAPRGVDLYYFIQAMDVDGNVLETSETQLLYLEPEAEQLQHRYVAVPSVKVYRTPETASESLTLDYMDALELGSLVTGSWYRVFREGQLYFIYGTDKLTDVPSDFSYTGNTPLQQEVLDLAMDIHRNWNTIYATGQSTGNPNADGTIGFNAPGLVKYILNSVMEEVPFYQLSLSLDTLYKTEKLYNEGYPGETAVMDVPMEDIQPGDVLFFGASAAPEYCGLYLGNGEFMYATSSAEDGIRILPLNSCLAELMAIRRYLPEEILPANTAMNAVGSYKTYKLYSQDNSSSPVLKTLALYDPVTVLFTDSGSWAYVETEDGTRGYMLTKYLGEYEYLDYVTLTASLNEEGRPYLTWNKVAGAVSYEIYRSLQPDTGFELLSATENTYYTNATVPEGLTVYYQVKVLAADGSEIDLSDVCALDVPLSGEEVRKTMYVSVPSLRLYALPDVASESVTLRYLEEVQLGSTAIAGDASSWHRVFLENQLWYLRLEAGEEKLSETRGGSGYTGTTVYQQQVIDLAMEICDSWNTIYATGQSEGIPNADGSYGFNSPGFVKYVLNTVMQQTVPTYRLSVSIDALYAADGLFNAGYTGEFRASDVAPEEILPGDVLFFGTTEPTYCGIYLGNEEFVYATSSWEDSVCVMPLSGSFRENLMAVRRYLPGTVNAADKTEYIVGPYYTYNLYSEMTADSEVVRTLTQYDRVTLLFTNSDQWGYIRTEDGTEGFFLIEHLGEYEYLEYLSVSAVLNEEGKPYLNWNKVKDAATYEVYRSLRPDSGFELMTATANTYYSNLSAPNGLTLYYQLRALDAQGNEIDVSDSVSVTTALTEEETLLTRYVYLPVVNLYELPEISSEPLSLRYMEELQLGLPVIVREDGTWYRVFRDGRLMYLWSSDISESLTETKSSFSYTGNTVYQQQVIDLALEISEEWKTIYAHEQSDGIPNADGSFGFDCSGLTSYIFNRVMQPLVPTYRMYSALETQYITTGMYNAGYTGEFSAFPVADDDLQPGDILFFTSLADGSSSTEIGHCGIYVGNNEFIHSTSSWEDAVCIMGLRGSYLENYVGARRYLPETVEPTNADTSIVGPYYSYNLYSQPNSASAVVTTLAQYDPLTVLFTDNDTWAYVRTEDGHEGFFLTEHLGNYEYLDHVVLNAMLNLASKPYLSWNKVRNAETYEVYRSIQENDGYALLSTTENTYYTNNTVPVGIPLYYRVRALDAAGNELDVSDTVSLTVPSDQPEVLQKRYVAASSVKLYALPDSGSDSVAVRYMEEVELGALVTGSWYRVFLGGQEYYIYLTEGDGKLTDTKSSFSYTGNTELQQEVLDLVTDIALNWNTIYATGQSDGIPNADGTYGFNSPGLVKYVFNSVMQPKVPFYQLSQVLDTLYATEALYNRMYAGAFAAYDVPQSEMEPGDVLFFGSSQDISYCGIYLGNGEFVYCSASWDDGVCIMPLKDFADSLVKIRRYIPRNVTSADEVKYIVGPYYTYKLYAEKTASSAVVATLSQYDAVTLLFTDNESWAYIRTEDGTEGYFLMEYFGEYEYLDYVTLSVELNENNRPYLSWNKVKDAAVYEVYRSIREAEGYALLSSTENTYYTNNTVPQGMTLYYKVRALDDAGNELDMSDAVYVQVPLAEPEVLKKRYVAASSVKVYDLPDTGAPSVTLRYMDEVQLGSLVTGSWYRVFLGEDLYYLYMTEGDGKLTDTRSSFSYTGNTDLQQEVLDLVTDIALNWNTVYATGQSNGVANADGTYGFNAPGLVKYVFNAVMQPKVPFYQLSQVLDTLYATTDLYSAGYPGAFAAHDVAQADMKPGDVLFFGSSSDISYCGIYLGSGEFVYSSASWDDGVCIMPLKDFADDLVNVRRYLPEEVTPAELTGTVTGSYKTYKVYEEKSASSTVIATLALGDPVTLLYTDSGSWGYIRTADGTTGYLLLKYFS